MLFGIFLAYKFLFASNFFGAHFYVFLFGIAFGNHSASICRDSGFIKSHLFIILYNCWRCCKTANIQHVLNIMLGLGDAGSSFFYKSRTLFEAVYVAVKIAFWHDFTRFRPPATSRFNSTLCDFAYFA